MTTFSGVVTKAGGGVVEICVDRATDSYPPVGGRVDVEVRPAPARWDGTIASLEELFSRFHATETLVFFHCDKCAGFTITIQRDKGILPRAIACRASGSIDGCDGRAVIHWLPPDNVPRVPAWELYNPNLGRSVPSDENAAVASVLDLLMIRSLRYSAGITGGAGG